MSSKNISNAVIAGDSGPDHIALYTQKAYAYEYYKEDGNMYVRTRRKAPIADKDIPLYARIPFLRGIVMLFAQIFGIVIANFTNEICAELDGVTKKKWNLVSFLLKIVFIIFRLVPSIILPQALFLLLDLAFGIENVPVINNLICGALSLVCVALQYALLGLNAELRNTYKNHGAEHMACDCYQKGLSPTLKNVKSCSRIFGRCGNNIEALTLIIGIFSFMLLGWHDSFWVRTAFRILVWPLNLGVAFELILIFDKFDGRVAKILKLPYTAFQYISTRRPDDKALRLAVFALQNVVELETNPYVPTTPYRPGAGIALIKKELLEILSALAPEEAESEALEILAHVLSSSKEDLMKVVKITLKQAKIAKEFAEIRASSDVPFAKLINKEEN